MARDRADRAVVGRQVARRIALGARAFAQHVERKAQCRRVAALRGGLLQRLVDVASEHELPPEQLDRAHAWPPTTVREPRRSSRPGAVRRRPGSQRLASTIALDDRLASSDVATRCRHRR